MVNINMTSFEQALKSMAEKYETAHSYISIVICSYAFITLPVYICVLLQRQMRTPTNYILVFIACSDLVLCALQFSHVILQSFVPFQQCSRIQKNYEETIVKVLNYNGRFTVYCISTWLCCLLALVRYSVLRKNTVSKLKASSVAKSAAVIVLGTLFALTPLYISLGPRSYIDLLCNNMTRYYVGPSALNGDLDGWPWLITRYSTGIMFKLIPCCILTIFIVLLVRKVVDRNRQRYRLSGNRSVTATQPAPNSCPVRRKQTIPLLTRRQSRLAQSVEQHVTTVTSLTQTSIQRLTGGHSDTTILLIIILALFLGTQLPQGIVIVISVVTEKPEYMNYFKYINELLSLLNSAISLLLYCFMNSRFRLVLKQLFLCNTESLIRLEVSQGPSRHKQSAPGRLLTESVTLKYNGAKRKQNRFHSPTSSGIPLSRQSTL